MDKQEYIRKIYNLARVRGLCRNQGEFAELLAINPSTLSKGLSGKGNYLTDNLLKRVRTWARQAGLEEEGQEQEERAIPSDLLEIYNKMAETIRLQAEIINRLQKGPGCITATEANAGGNNQN